MSTVRARFDGKVFVPESPVQIPVGEIVEFQYPPVSSHPPGSPAAIMEVLRTLPSLPKEDVAEFERLIEESLSKPDFKGVFDHLIEEDGHERDGD